jgi:hypothetical protein
VALILNGITIITIIIIHLMNIHPLMLFCWCTHSLVVSSLEVDVSADYLTVLIDDWLRFKFDNPRTAENALIAAFELRVALEGILLAHLQEKLHSKKSKGETVDMFGRSTDVGILLRAQYGFGMDGIDLDVFPSFFRKPLEWITGTSGFDWEIGELTEKLSEFLEFDISYRLDHPSPQDVISSLTNSEFLATFYEDGHSILEILEQSRNGTSHRFDALKEGVSLAPFLRYRSVRSSFDSSVSSATPQTKMTDDVNDAPTMHVMSMDGTYDQTDTHDVPKQDDTTTVDRPERDDVVADISPMRMLEEKASQEKMEQEEGKSVGDREELHDLMLKGKPQTMKKFSGKVFLHSSSSSQKEDGDLEGSAVRPRFVPRSERKHPR